MVRFPSVYRRLVPHVFRLSPRSRVRRLLLRRAVDSGWTSFDRRDFELNFLYFAPDTEFEFPPAWQALGIPASFRGHEGRVEGMDKLFEVWGSELEPLYVFDLGDRLLNFDAAQRLSDFDRPALVLWAENDKIFPGDHGERLAKLRPQGEFEIVANCRTFIPEEQPESLAKRLRQRLEETEPKRG